jgi:phage-related tail fiber protein
VKILGTQLDLTNRPAVNVADPSNAQDAATKNYVDALVRGLSWKDEVRAASTGNLTLSAAQTIDGVAVVAGDRVLVKDQTTQSANGIYVAAAGAWSRAPDADSAAELAGMTVSVLEGTVNAGRMYTMSSAVSDPITVGTTNLVYVLVGGSGTTYTAGSGLSLTGSTFAVVAGAGIIADGTSTRVDPAVVPRKFASSIGNGSLTSLTVNHALGTSDVHVLVFDNTTKEVVFPDVVITDANNVTVSFATAPASAAYRCVVIG